MTRLDMMLGEETSLINALAPQLETLLNEGPEATLYQTLVEIKGASSRALNMMVRDYE